MARRVQATSKTTQPNDNGQLEQLAAINGAAMGAFAEACQAYVKGVALINGELADFMNTRLRHDAELGEALAACKDWNEVVTLQQDWYQETASEYQAETSKLMEMATKMASESWTPVYQQVNATMESARKQRV
ncbi:MAG: phasin family protein [Pseudomonadota bacterium]